MPSYLLLLATVLLQPAEAPAAEAQPSVFELPRLQVRFANMHGAAIALLQAGKLAEAEKLLRQTIEIAPHEAIAHYNLACALARQDKLDDALASLTKAVDLGFNQPQQIEKDADLEKLREKPEFAKLVERSKDAKPAGGWKYSAEPAEIADGVANVTEKNTAWIAGPVPLLRPLFKFPETTEAPAVKGMGDAGALIQKWYEDKTAAGNLGDLYDNHDTDHSNMSYDAFPQLARVEFSDEAKKRHLHHGFQGIFLFAAPTIGNSSTALTNGPMWRCQGRIALTFGNNPQVIPLQYFSNQIYFYPEHRDYDPGRNGKNDGYGDVLPANTPYLVLSQGSSGSDRVFMDAFALTWAAFRPEVKEKLKKAGLLAPVSQMVFRRSNKQVVKDEDYFTGAAHPPVFDGGQLDPLRMVNLTHEFTVDALPPTVLLSTVEENEGIVGIDYFDVAPREKILEGGAVIARVVKSVNAPRRIVVSAEQSKDLNGQPLKFRWELLRGDPKLVQIKPLGERGERAEIVVQRHERRPIQEGSAMESSRVDVGVFAINEKYPSAPGFVCFQFLENQKHTRDENGRLLSVDYVDPEASQNYVDPLIDSKKNWRDEYRYDAGGKLIGWDRIRGEMQERFTFDGCLVTKTDDRDRPVEAKIVAYAAQQERNQAPVLQQVTTEQVAKYVYESDDDQHGKRE